MGKEIKDQKPENISVNFQNKKTKQGTKTMKKREFKESEYLKEVDNGYLSNIIVNDLNFLKKEYDRHTYNYYFLVDFLIISEHENEYNSQFVIWFDSEDLKLANVDENDYDQLYDFAYEFTAQYVEGIPTITCYRLMLDHEQQIFDRKNNGIL